MEVNLNEPHDLESADLQGADLRALDLRGADLSSANLFRAPRLTFRYTSTHQLLAAAVVSKKFRQLLLTNPAQAIAEGWAGQKFAFSSKERQRVISIKARTLEEFASQLMANFTPE